MTDIIQHSEYRDWLRELKQQIKVGQIKAAISVNSQLIMLYWDLGRQVVEKQEEAKWGSGFIEQLSKDLREEFPDMAGFSTTNLHYCRRFYKFYSLKNITSEITVPILPQVGAKLQTSDADKKTVPILPQVGGEMENSRITLVPWGHQKLLIDKCESINQALFYIDKTIENNWSRDTLALQIKSDLYSRQGRAITNFTNTLPKPSSDLAQQTLKDPYVFDFLQLTEDYKERDIENQLTQHITRFLLELGKGFAFVGKQYNIRLNQKEYFLDLLFYHIPMQCYVVVELKNRDFEPEFAGKLNFYLTLVDKTMKRPNENPTIGILLCRGKDNLEVEYALQDIHKPMGVSEFNIDKILPDNLKSNLPSIEELEEELKKIEE